jgi:hypothetical protein
MYRGVVWAKCIVTEESLRDFYRVMSEAAEGLEIEAQNYGWGMALPSGEDNCLPDELRDARES